MYSADLPKEKDFFSGGFPFIYRINTLCNAVGVELKHTLGKSSDSELYFQPYRMSLNNQVPHSLFKRILSYT